jgi:hypothetical protein
MADNWLSNAWEWLVPGEDDQGMFANIGDWWGGDDDYDDSVSIADFDQNLIDELLGEVESAGGLDSFLPTQDIDWNNFIDWGDEDPAYSIDVDWLDEMPETDTGIFGGQIGPWLRNLFLGSGGTGTGTGGNRQGGLGGLLGALLGGGDGGGGLLGGGGLGTLASLWALNKARKEGDDPGAVIPMGQQAYGMDDVYGGPTPDYRVFNIQPALMPGVAYANVGKPEGMKGGGIASLDGPGDVTPAWLEPGEFVMTKKATGNIGAQNLYKMMKEAEGMG